MELAIKSNPIPLKKDADGAIRVGETRVTLETVLHAFEKGSTCEEIVHQYPVLDLADVYEVIGYFLRNRSSLESYLAKREEKSSAIRRKVELRFDPSGIRERLLKRRNTEG